MAKAARKKATKTDVVDQEYPHTKLLRIIDDVISNKPDNKRPSYYAKAGDIVGLVAVHGHVLLVKSGHRYVYGDKNTLSKVKAVGEFGWGFPVDVSQTNYLDPDAKIIKREVKPLEDDGPKQRPSYYSKSYKKK